MAKIPRRPIPDELPGDEPEDETITGKELNALIDGWLDSARPDAYLAADHEWQEPIVDRARDHLARLGDTDVLRDFAQHRVRLREGQATRSANKLLRRLTDPATLDLDVSTEMLTEAVRRAPLALGDSRRVRLGAATIEDLNEWIIESSRAQDLRDAAEALAREGAIRLRDLMRSCKARRVDDLIAKASRGRGRSDR